MTTKNAAAMRSNPDDPRHGTVNGYQNCRCRCGPCKAARSDARRRARGVERTVDDRLLVVCWCETDFVHVAAAEVRALRTGSCGRAVCGPVSGVAA